MEIVSNKVSFTPTSTPQGSLRTLERKETFSHPRKWNANTQQRTSHRRRESLTGNSLMSLKAYYRKLRTFKGTIKALISFRRLPTFSNRSSHSGMGALTGQAEECTTAAQEGEPPRVAEAVAKLKDDDNALQTVQSQVKDLVEKGHVVTELGTTQKDEVTYRMQGNLEHYTETNLRKRLKLQAHPHMVALTQRLWLAAVHQQEDHLSFGEYEAYMLRLHRLILPEFDIVQSRTLIKDDWVRDTDGSDELDYRYFHLSMFELVDLWTDTIEAEDYISLLYCIMHSLTFAWNGRHLLRELDDINPIDIVEASKDITMDEIERDLSREVNSEDAQLYRDRIADDSDAILEGFEDGGHDEAQQPSSAAVKDNDSATAKPKTSVNDTSPQRKSSREASQTTNKSQGSKADGTPPPRTSSAARPANPTRKSTREDARSAAARPPPIRTSSVHAGHVPERSDDLTKSVLSADMMQENREQGIDASDASAADREHQSRDSYVQGMGTRRGTHGTAAYAGPRIVLSPNGGNQYAGSGNGDAPPISVLSLGSGAEYINMVAKPTYIRKPSALGAGFGSRRQGGAPGTDDGQTVLGYGLQTGSESVADNGVTYERLASVQANDTVSLGFSTATFGGPKHPTGRSTFVSPQSPQSPRGNAKDNEMRQGSLLLGVESYEGSISTMSGNLSPRARSAKPHARSIQSPQPLSQLYVASSNSSEKPRISGSGIAPSSSLSLDSEPYKTHAHDPGSLMVGGGLQSSRMSILARPSTSSPSSPRATFIRPTNGLDGFLQTRAYQETPLSPGRPSSRGTRVYHQRASESGGDDLVAMSLNVQSLSSSVSPRMGSPKRATFATNPAAQQRAFTGSIVGSSSVSIETHQQHRAVRPRASMAKIAQFPKTISTDPTRFSVDLGLAGTPARRSVHKETPISPRSAAAKLSSKRLLGER